MSTAGSGALGPSQGGVGAAASRSAAGTTVLLMAIVQLLASVLTLPAVVAGPRPRSGMIASGLSVLACVGLFAGHDWVVSRVWRGVVLLAGDAVVAVAILAVDGIGFPFAYASLGAAALSAALAGTVGVAVSATIGLLVCVAAFWQLPQLLAGQVPAGVLPGLVVPYVLVGILFAAVRHVHCQQVELRAALAAAGVEVGRSTERLRLARDLHDSLAKTVAGIGMSAQALQRLDGSSSSVRALSAQLAGACDQAVAESRELIAGLRGADTRLGPAETIRQVSRSWAGTTGTRVELDLASCVEMDEQVCRELVAVLREALDNVSRHAGAQQVMIGLHRGEGVDEGTARLIVRDDGGGFLSPPAEGFTAGGRFGLHGMAERMSSVGGRLSVRAAPGRGTTVVATVPLGLNAADAVAGGPGAGATGG